MPDVREYLDAEGRSPFAEWFADLEATAAGQGDSRPDADRARNSLRFQRRRRRVLEYRIDFGPGYRVYFGLDGDTLVILLGGGTKKRQQRDIETAKLRWNDYKRRKRQSR